jgi:membrane-associated phospholipid phosphatase
LILRESDLSTFADIGNFFRSAPLRNLFTYMGIAAVLFAITTSLIEPHEVEDAESGIFGAINGLPGAAFWPLWALMQLGNVLAVPTLAAAALMFRHLRLSAGLLLAGFSCWYLARVVKDVVGRGRPAELISDTILRQAPASGGGYVSGHAAIAFALATVLHPYLPKPWRAVAWGLAAVVGFARVYVGAHLPLDVVGGAALGCVVGMVMLLVVEPWRGDDEIEVEDEDAILTEV